MKKTKVVAWLLMLAMTAQTFIGIPLKADAAVTAADAAVTEADLADHKTAEPAKDKVVPGPNQYKYQKDELAAFCHFGPNTFNEIEWGESYGTRTPDDIFRLEENFDAETLVSTIRDAGFKKLIVTAKHHDGFCIWNSDYTDYDVESTSYAGYNYDGMGGDVLAEISAACSKYDIDMGLYLSPWDIHEPSYGYKDANGNGTTPDKDVLDYNEFYNNQLKEILGNDKYGNKGHFVEVWMDGAKGSGANAQEYEFQTWFDTIQTYEGKKSGKYEDDCMLFGAEAYTTVRWIGNELGFAHDETWAQAYADKERNTFDAGDRQAAGGYTKGYPDGNQWTVPEADARITSGWFWGTKKNVPKDMASLADMYFRSVGHNAPLLLNIPPNNLGKIDQAILDRVTEFGNTIRDTFRKNIAAEAKVSASEVRGDDLAFSPQKVLDGKDETFWTVKDGTNKGTLIVDLGETKQFDVVSIEEAIQFGQRISEFKVEYKNGSDDWKTFDEGATVGAKRLCRKPLVKADKLRITVKTSDKAEHKEPIISEVGVYRAAEGFAIGHGIPDGLTVIDDRAFSHAGWNEEKGDQFLEGTSMWRNPANPASNGAATLKFNGTKVWIVGTVDPNHGTADIYIDDQKVETINTYAAGRKLQQTLFTSDTLENKEHTIKIVPTNKAIGIDAALVLDNGGKGMVDIEFSNYTMYEDSAINVKLVRAGGSNGTLTVNLAPNPGSAIQDDYNTECGGDVTFADGETEKTVRIETRRNTNATGNHYFTIDLTAKDSETVLGFNKSAKVTIVDSESITKETLETLVEECDKLSESVYTSASWRRFTKELTAAKEKLASASASAEEIRSAYSALITAKEALAEITEYSEELRFQFPLRKGKTKVLEAELLERNNNPENDNNWPLQITEKEWASNGRFLNCLNANDEAKLYYDAPWAGTYKVTVQYRSGASGNGIVWEEAEGKVKSGSITAGAEDSAQNTHTKEFTMEVLEAGEGVLTFRGADRYNAPQIDKFDIVLEKAEIETEFSDVKEEDYFYDPVMWAASKEITSGVGDTGRFMPDDTCTRANVVTFLWRAAGKPEPKEGGKYSFSDVTNPEAYYYKAVKWAAENGIVQGVGNTGRFMPDEPCTRGHIVTFLWRAKGSEKVDTNPRFSDVEADAYYYDAVKWAVENVITSGVGDTGKFMPDNICSRAQTVSFLHRSYVK